MITNDGRYAHEIKSRIVTAKAAFNGKKSHFTIELDLNLGTTLVKW
jgi:hypothetical protein